MQQMEQTQVELEGYRLSALQQRVWQLQRASGDVYRAECAVLVEGELEETTVTCGPNR